LTSFFCLHLSGLTVAEDCWDCEGGGPTVTGNHTYTPEWYPAFQYDPNNPEEIDRNGSVEISVIGGFPPYTWQVSGTGFSIPSSTTDRTNTLSADDTACGAVTITVTDKYGDNCTGYIRCTEGQWTQKCTNSTNNTGCSPWNTVWSGDTYETIVGYQKWWMLGKSDRTAKCCPGDTVDCSWDNPSCTEPPCGNPCDCDGVTGRCGVDTRTLWPGYVYYEWQCP